MRIALLTPLGEGQLGTSLAHGLEAEGHEVVTIDARRLTSDTRAFERSPLHVPLAAPLTRLAARLSLIHI